MKRLRIGRAGPIRGRLRLPPDLHIGQCALTLAALATSPSFVRMDTTRSDHRALVSALRALGVAIAEVEGGFRVAGVGLAGLVAPRAALSAAASETTLQIVASLLACQQFGTRVVTDPALAALGLRTWLGPLRARGLQIAGKAQDDGEIWPPVAVAPLLASERPLAAEIDIPHGDAATKLVLLLTGLYAAGVTAIQEGVLSRDHVERALVALSAPVQTMGAMTVLDSSEETPHWQGFDWAIPGDFTLAAHWVALGLAVPGSTLVLEGVSTNRSRTAFFDALRYTGAAVEVIPKGDVSGNEPMSDIVVRSSELTSVRVRAELSMRAIDESSALAALVASTKGRVSVRDLARLRERPGNPLKQLVTLLRSFDVECTAFEDGFDAERLRPLRGAHVPADLPPELKLTACVLAANAEGDTRIDAPETLDALYPGFVGTLRAMGIPVTEENAA